MPTGNDAVVELMPNPQQREKMYHKIREYRSTKAIFGMDFQNDAQYVGDVLQEEDVTFILMRMVM